MIKVIEYGKYRQKCMCCESIIEFEKEDIQCRQAGMNEYDYYIVCPVCNSPMIVRGIWSC